MNPNPFDGRSVADGLLSRIESVLGRTLAAVQNEVLQNGTVDITGHTGDPSNYLDVYATEIMRSEVRGNFPNAQFRAEDAIWDHVEPDGDVL